MKKLSFCFVLLISTLTTSNFAETTTHLVIEGGRVSLTNSTDALFSCLFHFSSPTLEKLELLTDLPQQDGHEVFNQFKDIPAGVLDTSPEGKKAVGFGRAMAARNFCVHAPELPLEVQYVAGLKSDGTSNLISMEFSTDSNNADLVNVAITAPDNFIFSTDRAVLIIEDLGEEQL